MRCYGHMFISLLNLFFIFIFIFCFKILAARLKIITDTLQTPTKTVATVYIRAAEVK